MLRLVRGVPGTVRGQFSLRGQEARAYSASQTRVGLRRRLRNSIQAATRVTFGRRFCPTTSIFFTRQRAARSTSGRSTPPKVSNCSRQTPKPFILRDTFSLFDK